MSETSQEEGGPPIDAPSGDPNLARPPVTGGAPAAETAGTLHELGEGDGVLEAPPPSPKKQTTRMHKVKCPECGLVARMASKWIDLVGVVHCPLHGEMVLE